MTSRPAAAQHLCDLAQLRRVRARIDREYAQPLDVEALARGAHMSAGYLSRQFRLAYGESPSAIDDAAHRAYDGAAACGDLSVTEVCVAVGCSLLGTFSTRFTELVGMPPSFYRRQAAHATVGMPPCVAKQVSTDQESRSAGPRAAVNVTAMDITINASFLPHDDPDASLAFYRDTLGFEVPGDVEYGGMHWITVGPLDQPGTSIVLYPPAASPGITDGESRTIAEMMAKGTYACINLATTDLDGTFEQPYGIPDCAFRDPAGNLIRIHELR